MFCQSPKAFPLKAYKCIYTFSLFLFSTPFPIPFVKKGLAFGFLPLSQLCYIIMGLSLPREIKCFLNDM